MHDSFLGYFLSPSYDHYLSSNHLERHHYLQLPRISISRMMSMILHAFVSFILQCYSIHKVYLDLKT